VLAAVLQISVQDRSMTCSRIANIGGLISVSNFFVLALLGSGIDGQDARSVGAIHDGMQALKGRESCWKARITGITWSTPAATG
jgi:hypothetical protein